MKNLLKISALFLSLWIYSFSFASVTRFEVEISPNKVKVWESIDVTIKAVDSQGAVIKDYTGEVLIFSNNDEKAVFPGILDGNIYTFKTSDAGIVKFENAVKFTKNWIQDVSVYDNNDIDVYGYAEIEVTEWWETVTTEDINIMYPEDGITLGNDKVKISGSTLKNHQVKVILNNDKEQETISNSEWIYEVEISNIPSGENVLIAEVMDADGKIIGSSKEVFFKIESNAPRFKSIKVNPELSEYNSEAIVGVTVEATSELSTLDLIINDTVTKLKEETSGSYVGNITTPKDAGEYKIDIIMKNELGVETKENGVKAIKIKAVEFLAPTETEEPVEVNCDDFQKELEVKNIQSIKLKSKSIISWDKVDKATNYNVYKKERNGTGMTLIENVVENQYEIIIKWDVVEYDDFAVKAVFKDDVCNVESTNYSSMTKVQTGPKEMILLMILLSLWVWFFLLRRKNA